MTYFGYSEYDNRYRPDAGFYWDPNGDEPPPFPTGEPASSWTRHPETGEWGYFSEKEGGWVGLNSLGGDAGERFVGVGDARAAENTTQDSLAAQFPWLPDELLTILVDAYVETGDAAQAQRIMRASEAFERYFPGLRREEGTLRMTEQEYLSARDAFSATLLSVGVNPDFFDNLFIGMIEGDVSPREMTDRVETAYQAIVQYAPELRQWYTTNYGIDMTDEAIIASFLDPTVGEEILSQRVAVSQIGAAAAISGFDIDFSLAERLYGVGTTEGEAQQAFGEAAQNVPIFNALARRHNDPDDDFDINEFVAATLLDDPLERRRMRRLISQERSLFTEANALTKSQVGVTGLRRF